MQKNQLYLLGLATLIGFPVAGQLVLWLFEDDTSSFGFSTIAPIWQQLGIGLLAGGVAGGIAYGIIQLPFMKPVKSKYAGLLGSLQLSWPDILFISLCAGIGEEYFFRGVLQYYWGVWPTALVFVAIHGYLDPRDWRISIYGSVMVPMIAGLGYINNYIGLPAAMLAHAIIDVILLYQLKQAIDENRIA
jgi:membrane protease YdiL (CAAX protease family)